MTTALTLLIMATQFLTMVQTNPNVTPEFRTMAINIAEQAIEVATLELQKPTTPIVVGSEQPVTTPTQPIQQLPVVTQPIIINEPVKIMQKEVDVTLLGIENNQANFKIVFKDKGYRNMSPEAYLDNNGVIERLRGGAGGTQNPTQPFATYQTRELEPGTYTVKFKATGYDFSEPIEFSI